LVRAVSLTRQLRRFLDRAASAGWGRRFNSADRSTSGLADGRRALS
jgi:hypothetical protein